MERVAPAGADARIGAAALVHAARKDNRRAHHRGPGARRREPLADSDSCHGERVARRPPAVARDRRRPRDALVVPAVDGRRRLARPPFSPGGADRRDRDPVGESRVHVPDRRAEAVQNNARDDRARRVVLGRRRRRAAAPALPRRRPHVGDADRAGGPGAMCWRGWRRSCAARDHAARGHDHLRRPRMQRVVDRRTPRRRRPRLQRARSGRAVAGGALAGAAAGLGHRRRQRVAARRRGCWAAQRVAMWLDALLGLPWPHAPGSGAPAPRFPFRPPSARSRCCSPFLVHEPSIVLWWERRRRQRKGAGQQEEEDVWVLEDDVAFTGNASAWFDAPGALRRRRPRQRLPALSPRVQPPRRGASARGDGPPRRRRARRRPCEPPEGSPRDATSGDSRALWPVHKWEHIERLSSRLLGALRRALDRGVTAHGEILAAALCAAHDWCSSVDLRESGAVRFTNPWTMGDAKMEPALRGASAARRRGGSTSTSRRRAATPIGLAGRAAATPSAAQLAGRSRRWQRCCGAPARRTGAGARDALRDAARAAAAGCTGSASRETCLRTCRRAPVAQQVSVRRHRAWRERGVQRDREGPAGRRWPARSRRSTATRSEREASAAHARGRDFAWGRRVCDRQLQMWRDSAVRWVT